MLLAAVFALGQNTATVRLSQTEFTAEVGQYRFERPRVAVYDGNTDVTSLFYLNYYIKGQEDSTLTIDNKLSTRNPDTGTSVSLLYGLVTIGSTSGEDTIRVVARPRATDSQYAECEAIYVIHIPKVQPAVTLSQDSIHVHTNQLFGLPTARLYRISNSGDTTNITSYYDVSYTHSDGITNYPQWGTPTMLKAPATVTEGETVTMTYTPKADYTDIYEPFSKTYDVTMYEWPADSVMPVTLEWPDGKYVTAENSATVPITMPIVRDIYGNDVSRMVRYDFKAIGNETDVKKVINNMWSGSNGDYGSWYIQFAYQVNDSAQVRMTLKDNDDYSLRTTDSSKYDTSIADTIIVQGKRLKWTFEINPASVEVYNGYRVLTKDNWKMPEFVVRDPDGNIAPSGYSKWIGIPVGVSVTGNANTSATTDTITYRGERYVLWSAESWAFTQDSWASWRIDFTNYTPKDGAPWLLFRIVIYNSGTDEPIHDYFNFNFDVRQKVSATLSLSETSLSCNISKTKKAMMGFTEPTATVRNGSGIRVNDDFTLSYAIADSSTVNDFSIDAATGKITYTGDGNTNGLLYVVVTASAKDTARYNAPLPMTYVVNVRTVEFGYEVITDSMANANTADRTYLGKLHFTGAGDMAAGTVLTDMAGLSVQFGALGDADWRLIKSGMQDTEGTTRGDSAVYTEGAPVDLDENEIPISGTFAILRPQVNGFLTIDGRWVKDNHYRLIQVSAGTIVKTTDYVRTDGDHTGEQWMNEPLMAGQTYYLYNYGADNGTNEPSHLHGFNFEPAYLNSSDDHVPIQYSTTFVNGYTGTVASMLTEAAEGVTFKAEKAPGTKTSVELSNYLTVDSLTGVVTPLQRTSGISEDTATIKNRVIIRATVKNRTRTVTKVEDLYLFISDIPSYIVRDGETPSAGQRVTTTNISTKITMTFGGWQNGSGPYIYRNEELFDSWNPAKTDTVGQNGMTIDGFLYASQGAQNPRDEDYSSFNANRSSHVPWELPCRGTYLEFEPEENGTLIVYLLQNGILDYTGSGRWEDLEDGYVLKRRPLYILDEAAKPVTLDNTWVMDPSLLPSNSRQATRAGSYTEGLYRSTYNDENVKRILEAHGITITNSKDSDCVYDLETNYLGRNNKYLDAELDSIMAQWKTYLNYADTAHARQEIIHLPTGGYTLISKAFVRYTFQVKAGKSYYIFVTGSKLSPCGFSFVPTGFPDNMKTQNYSMTLDDDDVFDTRFKAVASTEKTAGELRNINVVMNRKFGRGKWTSICLPFSMSQNKFKAFFGNEASIITYDSIASDTTGTGYFTQHVVRSIVANRPYFICPSTDIAAGDTIHNVSIESDYGEMTVNDKSKDYAAISTLQPVTATAGSYVFAGSSIYHLKSDQRLSAYRAYIKPLSTTTRAISKMAVANKDADNARTVTGIQDVIADYGNNNTQKLAGARRGVYNLQGQDFGNDTESLPPGVYIINGKKVVRSK